MKLDNYECEGQMTIFDFLKKSKPKIEPPKELGTCIFSGHTCNKQNLWEVADTLDEIYCPHVCCRKCNTRNCGARCNGSEEPEKIIEVDCHGICDDPYCPVCNYEFRDWGEYSEVDCERCPQCNAKLDWSFWHRMNDE